MHMVFGNKLTGLTCSCFIIYPYRQRINPGLLIGAMDLPANGQSVFFLSDISQEMSII